MSAAFVGTPLTALPPSTPSTGPTGSPPSTRSAGAPPESVVAAGPPVVPLGAEASSALQATTHERRRVAVVIRIVRVYAWAPCRYRQPRVTQITPVLSGFSEMRAGHIACSQY